jgi:POT family proton-dependent oligopeptide transporter
MSTVADTPDAAPPAQGRPEGTFFGEPKALGFLAFTEAWERFSFYGMTSILVLYMTQALLLPGRIEGIAGFATFRAGLEGLFGPMSTLALASQIFGLYSGFVYFTPVVGGWIADRFIGRKRAVMAGALLMSGGHVAMAFDVSFLVALFLLITGCGLLKGNISAQVGSLYRSDDDKGRTRAFAIFSMAINLGAIGGPLVIGLLADRLGWHLGFGTAGALMLIALATYSAGYKYLPEPRASAPRPAQGGTPMTAAEWGIVAALIVTMGLTIFQSIAYYQIANIGLVWINQAVDLNLAGFRVPVPWFQSIDPLASVLIVPPLFWWWKRRAARGRDRGEFGKIAAGAWQTAFANGLLAVACLTSPDGRVSVIWPLAYAIILGIAFIYYWPTLLALVSRAAPARINATMMGTVFLSIFIGNILIGWIGSFYERMTPAEFWAMHAAIAATGGVLTMLLHKPLSCALGIEPAKGATDSPAP